jgi:hypothetical protein
MRRIQEKKSMLARHSDYRSARNSRRRFSYTLSVFILVEKEMLGKLSLLFQRAC